MPVNLWQPSPQSPTIHGFSYTSTTLNGEAGVPQQSEVLSLTGLRFVSAFYVFLFHIHMRWPLTQEPWLKGLLDVGAVGMSVFFILSGFLLCLKYHAIEGRVADYFVNRLARIYPIYFVAGLVTLPWLNIPLGEGLEANLMAIWKMLFIFVANLFVIQAWIPPLFSHWNNGGSWSISVEIFCYFLLPLIIPFLARLPRKGVIAVLALTYLFGLMFSLAGKLYPSYGIPVFYAMPIFRLPEFIVGVCVCLLLKDLGRVRGLWLAQSLLIALLCWYLGNYAVAMPYYVGHNWLVVPVIAFVIGSLFLGGGPLDWLLSRPLFVWLGKISYCFYSFQALVLLFLIDHHDALVARFPVFNDNHMLALAAFVVLTLLSALGFYFIEEPSRKWVRRKWKSRGQREVGQPVADPA